MTDQSKGDPVTINQWFGDASIPKQYWNETAGRWVKIVRKQADNKDMGMWTSRSSGFNRIGAMVTFDGHYFANVNMPDTSYAYEYDSDGGSYSTSGDYMGSFSGNIFNGTYNGTLGTAQISGTVTAEFSSNMQIITSLDISETSTAPNFQKTFTFKGVNIPLDYTYYQTNIYQVQGEAAGDHITSLTFTQTAAEGLSYSLQSWSTDWNSKVWVSLSVKE